MSAPKEPKPERLPFEPAQNRKKSVKNAANNPAAETGKKPGGNAAAQKRVSVSPKAEQPKKERRSAQQLGVPDVVSKRMARRMAFFCGVPTALGMLTFVVSYLAVIQAGIKLPNVAVVLVSMAFFGLGVIGLSYGILSASWDEERVGSRLGSEEFSLNFGRLTEAWKAARQKKLEG